VFLLTLGEFGVPNFLRYDVFTLESFVQFSAFYDFGAATAAVIPLVAITGIVLMAEWMFLRERFHQVQAVSDKTGGPPVELGESRTWLLAFVALLCFFIVVLPLLVLLARSSSVSVYGAAFRVAYDSLLRSLLYAAVGASLLALIGFFSGYLIHHQAMPFWRAADTLTIFLFALPSTVIGIGLISMWNRPWTNFVYGTVAMIIFGYLVKYTALTSRITASVLTLVPRSMEEAGQAAGLRWLPRIGSIVMPMARRGILAGWLVGYIFCLRDLETTMIVYPPGYETLPVRITTLMANSPAELIAALCVVMVGATVLPPALLWTLFSFNRRTQTHETR
jgi:iron(III) transport system permease protein